MIFDHRGEAGGSLEAYLGSIAARLRAVAAARGAGALGLTALGGTAACVFFANQAAFSRASVIGSRAILLAALGAAALLLLVLPLRRLARERDFARAADEAERRSAEFAGRLRTWADERARADASDRAPSPLLALLARETAQASALVPVDALVSRAQVGAFAATGLLAASALVWLGAAGPGYWGYGTSRLWAGWLLPHEEPLYELRIAPGDASIREGGRLDITALPLGFEPPLVELHAKFDSSVDWERAPMGPQLQGAGYEFSFAAVREPLRYYVEAGRLRSREFKVDVVAMPAVENIRLEFEYPAWSGLDPGVQDPGGDVTAVAGTKVAVILTTDKELEDGLLVVGGREVPLRGNRAQIEVGEDALYHVAAVHRGERVRLTEDYFITAVPDEKPEVRILEPGRDWRATSIEEVAVRVEAADDFGLRSLQLHYAVNGVRQERVRLPVRSGARQAAGRHVFALENLGAGPRAAIPDTGGGQFSLPPPVPEAGLVPGDLLSYFVVAKDARKEVRSDMYFISVQPFERRFSQSQRAGGQDGQGQRQDEISRRQKEIVLATWNLIKERAADDGREERKLRESAQMLSELQATLMQRARTLVERARARQLTEDPQLERFAGFLEQAAGFMEPAAAALQGFRLDDAVGPEQQALQFLLRAENLFTDIQVSRGRGGGGGGASRDLAEMFELEMDLEKNQYETGNGSSGRRVEQEVDEAVKRLEELARRQERLARQARDGSRASFDQRWQQEVLRREAEDLKRELEQFQRRQQARGGRQARDGRGQDPPAQRAAGGQSGAGREVDRVIRQLERAAREMERGGREADQRASSARAQQELQEAVEALRRQRQQQSQAAVSGMAAEAERLVQEQERAAGELDRSLRAALEALKAQGGRQEGPLPTGMTREEEIDLADRKRGMRERLAEIEKGIQQHARMLRRGNGDASRALMQALIELQQSEALPAMQYGEDLIRRGLAPYAAGNEEAISRAIRQLRDNLREAGDLARRPGGSAEEGLEKTLAGVERMRRDLEQALAPGQRPGAASEGRRGWGAPPLDPAAQDRMERALEAGLAGISRLARQLRARRELDEREIAALGGLARELGEGPLPGSPELLEQEYRKMLALLEQIEVKLRRQVELDDKEEVRAIVSEPVPESYREAVAEYYRRLGGAK